MSRSVAPEIPSTGFDGELYLKDEARNPTWSHKDRLNRVTVSAAVISQAAGVVVASSGNHGGSAAAYSAAGGFHPVSNLTTTHTGHGFGPEGLARLSVAPRARA